MNVAVIRHLAFESLGLLKPLFEEKKLSVQIYDAGVDDIASAVHSADLVVILGGPISAYDIEHYPFLTKEIEAIQQRLQAQKPTLGICLGAQLMASALGARIYAGNTKEIGWKEVILTPAGHDSCLSGLVGIPVLHWHGDTFDIPNKAIRLAGTAAYPNQAFSLGRNILALQFHTEADPLYIEQWLIGHSCELALAGIDPRAIRRQTEEVMSKIQNSGIMMMRIWLEQLFY
jgi:GMP synthase (glutamine-hydrolysing)